MNNNSEKIERLRLFLIESPVKMTREQGVGSISNTIKRVLVELTSSSGYVGWGEAAPWEVFTGTCEAAFAAIDIYLRSIVISWPIANIRGLTQAMDRCIVGHGEAKVAIECAMFDLLGKVSGLSVAELLGGRVREKIPLSFSVADPDFSSDLNRVRAMWADGHRIFKVKTGVKTHQQDRAHLDALRSEFGDEMDLRVDYNQSLQPFGAMRVLRDIDEFAPTFIEQPVPRDALTAMARYVSALDTPILADESCFDISDLLQITQSSAADAISVKLMKTGSIFKAQSLMAVADAAHLPGYGGTLWEGGVALAAATQFIASAPGVSLGCEFYMPHHVLIEDVLEERVPDEDGYVIVPRKPGLGVTTNESLIRMNSRVVAVS